MVDNLAEQVEEYPLYWGHYMYVLQLGVEAPLFRVSNVLKSINVRIVHWFYRGYIMQGVARGAHFQEPPQLKNIM